jgi:acyl-CoA thioester hydrolase
MPGFEWPIRVYWEDTDAGGVVYYATYLKFLERARTEWLRALGIEQPALAEADNVVFVVRRIEVDYLRPAVFDDSLVVVSQLESSGGASLRMAQSVWRGEVLLLTARVKIACVTRDGFRPAKIPGNVIARLAA